MGNNVMCKVAGIGATKFKMHDGVVRTLKNARHVPNLKKNPISLGNLDIIGYCCTIEVGFLKVTKGILVALKGKMVGTFYELRVF